MAGLAAITISNSGGYSQEVWRRAFGDPADDALPEPHRFGAPTSGPKQPGAYDLGNGGYHCPSVDQQNRMKLGQTPWNMKDAFEAAARERQIAAHPSAQQIREAFAQAEKDGTLVPKKEPP